MDNINFNDYITKLAYLEERVGTKVSYRLMEPLSIEAHDPISVQAAAKTIANYISLSGYTFIVSYAKQKSKVGGHIELSTSNTDVFIEISDEAKKYDEAVCATLCHELSHKWLQINNIRLPNDYENEILTDIATIFLGLGKMMLNGITNSKQRAEFNGGQMQTITEHYKTGYLGLNQMAYIYTLVSEMRNITTPAYLLNLNSNATQAVWQCKSTYDDHYCSHADSMLTYRESLESLHKSIGRFQDDLALLDKHLNYIKKAFCDPLDDHIGDIHGKLQMLHRNSCELVDGGIYNPSLKFLRTLSARFELERMENEICPLATDNTKLLKNITELPKHLFSSFNLMPSPTPDMFNVIKCPRDGTMLRLPKKSGNIAVICPTCKYSFSYNTNPISVSGQSKQIGFSLNPISLCKKILQKITKGE